MDAIIKRKKREQEGTTGRGQTKQSKKKKKHGKKLSGNTAREDDVTARTCHRARTNVHTQASTPSSTPSVQKNTSNDKFETNQTFSI